MKLKDIIKFVDSKEIQNDKFFNPSSVHMIDRVCTDSFLNYKSPDLYSGETNLAILKQSDFVENNQIIFDTNINKIYRIFDEHNKFAISDNHKLIKLIDSDSIDIDYLFAWINLSDKFKVQYLTLLTLGFKQSSFLEFEIDIPAIEKQKDIGMLYKFTRQRFSAAKDILTNDDDILSNIFQGLEYGE